MATEFFMPSVNVMGVGCVAEVPKQVRAVKGAKVLIVTDQALVAAGVVAKVTALLDTESIPFAMFDTVQPNPTTQNVADGLAMYETEGCDVLMAVGGGSPIDCAKGIGLVAGNGGSITYYEGLDVSAEPMPPLITVNTTAGTASEMTRFTIITDTERKVKMAIVDRHVTPTVSVNDPELMASMPPSLTAATGMDALTHAIEALVSTGATPLTDSVALTAIELIGQHLPAAVKDGSDMAAREQMAYAQFMAGMAFNNASLGYVHAMAHQLGGFYDLPHGVCNAILLPVVSEFNAPAAADKLAQAAAALGAKADAAECIKAIRKLSKAVGIPSGLAELGVKEDDFATLANNAMKDACMLTNPREAAKDDVIGMYANAM
ncbi:MAG: iron-containing alcohol dehydrogenase [Planctomycetota bacterium]|jgi:alcohol dehydrogenase